MELDTPAIDTCINRGRKRDCVPNPKLWPTLKLEVEMHLLNPFANEVRQEAESIGIPNVTIENTNNDDMVIARYMMKFKPDWIRYGRH